MSEPPINDIPTVSGPDYQEGNKPPEFLPEIKGYKIIKQLGEGGMGIVYLAEQTEPIKRKVAIKIVKPGMDSREVIARFEAEKQTLAQLDHPNIAHVYDAGTTEKGRPYFVMEYINGVPITDFCDQQRLSIEERLELFMQVCEGIQHAHQRGIIHRDIKPSNILILTEEGKAIPKIIDFGVAKAIRQELTEQTMFTAQGQLLGTPEYMSPEQADLTNYNIDTRTDVYSLGVVLYQLLTGALPFDPQTLRKAAFAEIQRIIKEENPPKPSTKLSSLGKEAQEIAETRRTSVGRLTQRLHKELEWIPLKAMRKESDRRYQSVSELAGDIQNYLNGSPLLAGPESKVYRAKKFIRRNIGLVASSAVIFLILIAGFLISTIFGIEARRQAAIAEAVNEFLNTDLLKAVSPEQAQGKTVTVRDVLDIASEKMEGRFSNAPLIEASVRTTIGETYRSLGDYKAAEPHLEKALKIYQKERGEGHPETIKAIRNLGNLYNDQGKYNEAKKLLERAFNISQKGLRKDNTESRKCAKDLALLYLNLGRPEELGRIPQIMVKEDYNELQATLDVTLQHYEKYDEVEQLLIDDIKSKNETLGSNHPDTIESMQVLANLYTNQGYYNEAEALLAKAVEKAKLVLGENHPKTLAYSINLAEIRGIGQIGDKADKLLEESIQKLSDQLGTEHIQVLKSKFGLATLYINQKQYSKAEGILINVLRSSRKVLGEEAPFVRDTMRDLSFLYREWKHFQQSEEISLDLYSLSCKTFGYEHPETFRAAYDLIRCYIDQKQLNKAKDFLNSQKSILAADKPVQLRILGLIYFEIGDFEKALDVYRKAIQIEPHYANTYISLGNVYRQIHRYSEAVEAYQASLDIKPNFLGYWMIGKTYDELKRYDEAIDAYKKAVSLNPYIEADIHLGLAYSFYSRCLYDQAIENFKMAMQKKPDLSYASYNGLGLTYSEAGRNEDAIIEFEKAINLEPNNTAAHLNLAVLYIKLYCYDKAIKELRFVANIEPNGVAYNSELGEVFIKAGRYDEAIEPLTNATLLKPDSASASRDQYNLGIAYAETGRYDEAAQSFEKCIALDPNYHDAYRIAGLLYLHLNRYDQAIKMYNSVLKIIPEDEDKDAEDLRSNLRMAIALKGNAGQDKEISDVADINKTELALEPNDPNSGNMGLVGDYDDLNKVKFEGLRTFTVEEVRDALITDKDVILASHHKASLSIYLKTLKDRVLAGYKHNGFPDAKVNVSLDPQIQTIVVRVIEGPRYFCGDIKVIGAEKVQYERLIYELSHPFNTNRSDINIRPSSEVKADKALEDMADKYNQASLYSQVWEKWKPAPLSEISLSTFKKQVEKALKRHGYFFSEFEIKIAIEPNKFTVPLVIEFKSEGPEGIVDEIEISGNVNNTRAEIIEYLNLNPGIKFDYDIVENIREKLYLSGRFLSQEVSLEQFGTNNSKLRLKIELTENKSVPSLSKKLSELELELLKFRDYLQNWKYGQDDIIVSLEINRSPDMRPQLIISPQNGIIISKLSALNNDIISSVILSHENLGIFSPNRQNKWEIPTFTGAIIGQIYIKYRNDPASDKPFEIILGAGCGSKYQGIPFDFDIQLDPAFFTYKANNEGIHYSRDGDVSTFVSKNSKTKIETDTGRLIEYVETGEIISTKITTKRGEFSRAIEKLKETESQSQNMFNAQRPLSSTIRYLLEDELFQMIMTNYMKYKGYSTENIAKTKQVLKLLLDKNSFIALDRLWVELHNKKMPDSIRFVIPVKTQDSTGNTVMENMITRSTPIIFKLSNDTFPRNSWPWTLAHEAVFFLNGKQDYLPQELDRIYNSKETGPIGFWATAQLLSRIKSPAFEAFASRALERLSTEEFRKDSLLLLEGKKEVRQAVTGFAKVLQGLDSEEVEAFKAILSPEKGKFLQDAVEMLQAGKDRPFDEVLPSVLDLYWERLMRKNIQKNISELYCARGKAFSQNGQNDIAIQFFGRAIEINPESAEAYYNLGAIKYNLGLYQESINSCKEATRLKTDDANAFAYLGAAYGKLGRFEEAVEAYKQVVNIAPDDLMAHISLGAIYCDNLRRYEDAVENFKQALHIKPDCVEAHYNLSVAYTNMGLYKEAIKECKQTINLKSDFFEAYNRLGTIYCDNLGCYEEAIKVFKQAILINPDDAQVRGNLGIACDKFGHYEEAVEAYKQAINLKPDYAKIHHLLGMIYLKLANKESALAEYEILKTLDNDMANELLKELNKDKSIQPTKNDSTGLNEIFIGKPFPQLEFNDLKGNVVNIGKLKGKVVLVDFWATWCGPCTAETPNLISVYNEFKDKGLEIISISLDKDHEELNDYLEKHKIQWPNYYDGKGWDNEISSRFGIHGIPEIILIDREGIVRETGLRGDRIREAVSQLIKGDFDSKGLIKKESLPSGNQLEITAPFALPPLINGVVGANEWSTAGKLPLPHGTLYAQHDNSNLYLLVDLTEDTFDDPVILQVPDYFGLTFDVDRNAIITPNVDIDYGFANGSIYNFGLQYYLGPNVWTRLLPTISKLGVGFGPSPSHQQPHRIWEFAISLSEIKADINDVVRAGLKTHSHTPFFEDDIPPSFENDFSNLIRIWLKPVDAADSVTTLSGGLLLKTPKGNDFAKVLNTMMQCTNKEELEAEITKARMDVDNNKEGHVIVGRVVLDGEGDVRDVDAQMEILPGGFFAGDTKDLIKPVGFRMHRYAPYDLQLKGLEGDLVDVGTIHMTPLKENQLVDLKGKVALEENGDPSKAILYLSVRNGPVNTTSGGTSPRSYWPESIKIQVIENGLIKASGFSPIEYWCRVTAPDYLTKDFPIEFNAGQTFDLGTITLEKPKQIRLSYIVSEEPPFDLNDLETVTIPAGTRWKAVNDIYGWDLEFKQEKGSIIFAYSYGPCFLQGLGKGEIADYVNVDKTKIGQNSPWHQQANNEHVYLLHQVFWKRWILFKIVTDVPKPSTLKEENTFP
jgi:non-specific serine/threonine protein kinase/serine/threonine-protein kinase